VIATRRLAVTAQTGSAKSGDRRAPARSRKVMNLPSARDRIGIWSGGMRLCETSGGRPAAASCALENEMAKVAVQFTDTMDHYLLCRPQATSGQVLKPKASNGTSPIFFLRTYSSGFRLQSSTSQPWLPEELRVGIRDGAEVGRAPYLALPSPPPLAPADARAAVAAAA
jgi:hypothetical protein